MKKFNKYISIFVISFAVLGFLFLSLGGEYLHSLVHDHDVHEISFHHECSDEHDHEDHDDEHSDDGASEECPIFKLLVQSFINFDTNINFIEENVQFAFYPLVQSYLYNTSNDLPQLRAPPIG